HDYFKSPAMLPRMPSAVIPNAIDTKLFLPKKPTDEATLSPRRSLAIGDDDVTLVFIGRVVEEKRVEELFSVIVQVLEQRPQVKMLFVGSGGAIYDLEQATHHRHLEQRIIFTGFINWDALSLYYRLGDIFVTASLSEMHSMTVLEALVSRLPVVCRRDESFFDTVFHGENGYLADSDEAMVSHIIDLVDHPERRAAFAARSHEIAKHFSLRTHGLRTVAFYEAALARYPQAVSDAELRAAVAAVQQEED
ncbi:MAG: glycosyltransferase, partial [Treponemataceae bacterium]|nr:glycosyltransferase [Treponemataceae bacterium]